MFVAMVSTAGLSQCFIDILRAECPFVFDAAYLDPRGSQHRDLDFFEQYSGAGNLWKGVAQVAGLAC